MRVVRVSNAENLNPARSHDWLGRTSDCKILYSGCRCGAQKYAYGLVRVRVCVSRRKLDQKCTTTAHVKDDKRNAATVLIGFIFSDPDIEKVRIAVNGLVGRITSSRLSACDCMWGLYVTL